MSKAIDLVESRTEISEKVLQRQVLEYQAQMEQMQLRMEEQLSGLSLMIDNQGWTEVFGYNVEGPTWREVLDASEQIRSLAALNAHMKRGLTLRHSYIWEGGIRYDGLPEAPADGASRRGRKPAVLSFVEDPINIEQFFGPMARFKREGACYTNGQAMYRGVDGSPKRIYGVPIWEITDHYVNPDNAAEVWAYRRSWQRYTSGGNSESQSEWIFAYEHLDKRRGVQSITYNGKSEKVAQDQVMFVETVNQQEGFRHGLPDALAAMQWARVYRDAILDGRKMTSALATLAFKLKGQTAAGANAAAVKVQNNTAKGGTAAMVDGMDVAALATAGRAYDFDALRPLLSVMATALEVSVVALSSDPGAAGSSYGSASTLDLPTRLAMESRRLLHIDLDKKVFKWVGEDVEPWFEPLGDGADLYREAQALLLPWLQGLYQPQEMRNKIDALFGWPEGRVPDGVMLPNNEASVLRRDIDPNSSGSAPASTTAAPDQGTANGVGGQGSDSGNDVRTDGIG